MKFSFPAIFILIGLFAQVTSAQEDTVPAELVPPSAFRIRVEYGRELNTQLLRELNEDIDKYLASRERRMKLSERALSEAIDDELDRLERDLPKPAKPGEKPGPFEKELQQIQKELEAARRAAEEEKAALKRGDEEEAKKWGDIKRERIKRALDLAALIRELEAALEGLSAEEMAQRRRDFQEISRKALEKIRVIMKDFKDNQPADAGAVPLPDTK